MAPVIGDRDAYDCRIGSEVADGRAEVGGVGDVVAGHLPFLSLRVSEQGPSGLVFPLGFFVHRRLPFVKPTSRSRFASFSLCVCRTQSSASTGSAANTLLACSSVIFQHSFPVGKCTQTTKRHVSVGDMWLVVSARCIL